jgi:hypothetical protein
VRYDKKRGVLLKFDEIDKTNNCYGSIVGVTVADSFTLLSIHLSPSAECVFVLDDQFAQKAVLYGFGPKPVAPNQVLLIEDMIHFAPVHPERLQLVDLKLGTKTELYPPKGDAMRAKLASENAAHMPTQSICMKMNDPCDPKLFDEDIAGIATGTGGRFAIIVNQWAGHATVEEQPPVTAASQSVLYIYARSDRGWEYCESAISGEEAAKRTQGVGMRSWQFDDTAGRCIPNLPVVPDMTTGVMNPFLEKNN